MIATWDSLPRIHAGVLLVVNSLPSQVDEIDRILDALDRRVGLDRVSVIAPVSLRSWLVRRGIKTGRLLVARLSGLQVELGFFLESDRAVQWAACADADVVVGSEPYAPKNEEVKSLFERRIAPMVEGRRYLAHSLPAPQVFVWTADDLGVRASRALRLERYRVRARAALASLHDRWRSDSGLGASTAVPAQDTVLTLFANPLVPPDSADAAVAADLRHYVQERLLAATKLACDDAGSTGLRVVTDPADAAARKRLLSATASPVRRPAQVAGGLKWKGTRLAMRGSAEGPYSYLITSRPTTLRTGDSAIAEGRVYRGGVTIGLVKDGRWASKVDIDEPGRFLAAAVAVEAGQHALVVANCLKGGEGENAFALKRFGWARQQG